MDLKVVGWTDYDSSYPSITVTNEELNEVLAIVVEAIREGEYMLSGEEHQCSYAGVPVFDNGTCFRASMRSWGTIMSFAYPEINGQKTNYMDFYMNTPAESNLPDALSIDIEAMVSDNFNGLITPQDSQMISQSVQMGIPFMTTDKALNHLMDEIKALMEEGGCGCDDDDCDCHDGCDCDEDDCDCGCHGDCDDDCDCGCHDTNDEE